MKFKINFDKKAVGKFFLEHTEKVIFGFFILVFATIIYGAVMKREKFDKIPKDLSDKCNMAEGPLGPLKGERPDLLKPLETRDYKKDADIIAAFSKQGGISEKSYECDNAWDKPFFSLKGSRDQPELFDVQDLRAAAEFGAFQINATPMAGNQVRPPLQRPVMRAAPGGAGGAGSGTIRGQCWVVITGLVPVEMQASAYRDAFRDAVAYDSQRDLPTYKGYYVDRAEINSPADVKKPKWTQKFNFIDAQKEAAKDWAQQQPEVVEDKYVDPILTFPLGPLQNRSWGKSVAHEPEIPLRVADAALTLGADARTADRNAASSQFVQRDARGMVLGRNLPRTPQGRQEGGVISDSETVKYKLLRFFDFTAKPGKSYLYRVRLILNNPNRGLDAGKLKKPEFAQKTYLETPGTTQTSVIYIPRDTQILVGTPKSDDLIAGKFPLVLLKWVKETGREGYLNLPAVDRGQVLNITDENPIPVPNEASSRTPSDTEDMKNSDFITDATVLDVDGGRKLIGKDRKLTEPRDVLFMVVNGKTITLMERNELDDMSEINRLKTPETSIVPDRSRTPPPGRGRTDGETQLLDGSDPRRATTRPRTP